MLDIKFIRDNPDIIKAAARKKHVKMDVDRLVALDEKRRKLIAEVDEMRRIHKEASDKVSALAGEERAAAIEAVKGDKEKLIAREHELKKVEEEFGELMLEVPNVPDLSVPEGESDAGNKEIRKWGEVKELAGKDYLAWMGEHNAVDLERGAKVAGFRGYFLKGPGITLSMALWRFALDFLAGKGFTTMLVPTLVREENLTGTGWFPQSRDDIYKTQDDLYLSGTAEVPLMGYHRDEVLSLEKLPKKYAAFSPCFRREAGSYGKDEKGLFRVHEFYKVEQVVLCAADHQESIKWHEELTKNSEEIMKILNIPYRVVVNCGGDLGLGQVKKHDIEGWLPSEKRYRETHSASYFHDFQTRRLNIKYKDSDGKTRFAHSLNNTAIATPRILEAFVENNQKPDGTLNIPEHLRKYF